MTKYYDVFSADNDEWLNRLHLGVFKTFSEAFDCAYKSGSVYCEILIGDELVWDSKYGHHDF
jgi:hypothetical protein